MNIIIPMAGFGSRFSNSKFGLPKPLINIAGKAMYRWAVDCMPLKLATKLVFILIKNDYTQLLIDDINDSYANIYPCSFIVLDEVTRGQAETVLKAAELLDLNVPSLVHNCDTYIQQDLPWTELIKSNIDGAIVLFDSSEKRWSYAKLNVDQTEVIEVKEKEVISGHASTGTYFFKKTNVLLNYIQQIIDLDHRENNEFYLSTVYSLMLKDLKKITPLKIERILCFGTPQDLVDSLNEIIINSDQYI